jgi:hypothetical protein
MVRFQSFSFSAIQPLILDDSQTLAAFEATGSEHLATAFGGAAGAEADLVRALFAMRAECRLHDLVEKRGSR